jgi:hypothetical protein
MCNEKKQTRKDAIKEKLNASKELLEENLKRGEDTLCEYIKNVINSHRANITSTDGIKQDME